MEVVGKNGDGPETSTQMLRALAGDANSVRWTEFVRRYTPLLRRYFARFRASHPELGASLEDDVIQETMLALVKAFPSFHYDCARGSFRGYLLTILSNKARDFCRVTRVKPQPVRNPDSIGPRIDAAAEETCRQSDAVSERLELMRELWAILLRRVFAQGRFSEQSQAVFRAVVLDERPIAEIAVTYGLRPNAVYQLKNRVLLAVKRELRLTHVSGDDLNDLVEKLTREDLGHGAD